MHGTGRAAIRAANQGKGEDWHAAHTLANRRGLTNARAGAHSSAQSTVHKPAEQLKRKRATGETAAVKQPSMQLVDANADNSGNVCAGLYSDAHHERYGYYEYDIQADMDANTRLQLADLSSKRALRLTRRFERCGGKLAEAEVAETAGVDPHASV